MWWHWSIHWAQKHSICKFHSGNKRWWARNCYSSAQYPQFLLPVLSVLSIAFINVILHMSSPLPWLLSASLPPSNTLLIEYIYSLVGKMGQWFWAKHMLGTEDAEMKEAGPLQQGTHILGRDLYRYWQSFANSLVETGTDSLLKHRGERSSHWKVSTHSESSSSSAPYSRMPSCPEMWGFRCILQPLPPTTLPLLLYHTQTQTDICV